MGFTKSLRKIQRDGGAISEQYLKWPKLTGREFVRYVDGCVFRV